jgi:hypothetical protein
LQSVTKFEAERAELDAVLASGFLGRNNNLVRLLTFVCEKYFEGETNEIKEYSIALQALGRPQNFDPQVDTIVRVTAHTLRKRLDEFYRSEGALHTIQICLPPGHYVPNFVRKSELEPGGNGRGLFNPPVSPPPDDSSPAEPRQKTSVPFAPEPFVERTRISEAETADKPKQIALLSGLVIILVCLASLGWYFGRSRNRTIEHIASVQTQAAAPISSSPVIRVMLGGRSKPYSDRSGFVWEPDRFCSGGDSFSVSKPIILGTGDPELFLGGRRGMFHCKFPSPPGTYEVHLLFAETAGLQENARTVGFSLNGGAANSLDVVDDADADDTATTKVFTDVEPQSDGAIHLDFTTPDSFLNAVEILPGVPHHALPVRIVAGRRAPYHDASGNVWMPDRYYFGGRASDIGNDVSKLPDGGLYEGQRIGHFHYVVPVVPAKQYTVKLHFIERWFGIQNQNIGGIGSRVFDVSCNGTVLLKDFDIMREAGSGPLVKSFSHIEPTRQGKIELYFTPGVNYPLVTAIEVISE